MALGTLGALALGGIALGGVASAGINASASRRAVDASTAATAENNALAREIYAQNRETLAPFVQQGGRATQFINQFLGLGNPAPSPATGVRPFAFQPGTDFMSVFGGSPQEAAMFAGGNVPSVPAPQQPQGDANAAFDAYRNTTGYNFRLNEGLRALRASQGARGLGTSSDTFRRAMTLGQEMGSAEANNFLNALLTQQQLGANAAGNQAGVASNFSSQVQANNAQNASNIGNAALAQAGNNTAFLNSLVGLGGAVIGRGR